MEYQGFFQAFSHNTDLAFQTEFVKGQRHEKISRGPGQSPGGGPGDETSTES